MTDIPGIFELGKPAFHITAEGIKHEHIDYQMHPVCMDESVGNKTVDFLPVVDLVWIEQEPGEKRITAKGKDRY
jgi:hypothetical protein